MLHSIFSLERQVTGILRDIGVPAHLMGYRYLREAIVLTVNNMSLLDAVTKKLYPAVAKAYDTTPSRAERAMRTAIGAAWKRGDEQALKMHFGNAVCLSDKPTNSEFIAMVADQLMLERKELEGGYGRAHSIPNEGPSRYGSGGSQANPTASKPTIS